MKMSKRIIAMILAVLLTFGTMAIVYAADPVKEDDTEGQNNTIAGATPIEDITAGCQGDLSSATDVDYYQFEITTKGYAKLNFNFSGAGDATTYFNVALYPYATTLNAKNALVTMAIKGNAASNTSDVIALPVGKYLVEVKSGASCANYTYTIKTTTVSMPYKSETEPNDSADQADALTPNETTKVGTNLLYGTLSSTDTADWYTFTLAKDGYVSFNMLNGKKFGAANSNFDFGLWYYTNDVSPVLSGICMATITADQDQATSPDIGLRAGTYYIKACNGVGSYGIEVYAQADNFSEAEPNGKYTTANLITNGNKIYASLINANDTDVFKVDTTSEVSSKITVAPLSADKFDGELSVKIVKKDKTTEVVTGTVTKDKSFEYDLGQNAASSYYIVVTTGGETPTTLYTITATKSEAQSVAPDGAGFWDTIKYFIMGMDWSQFDTYKELIGNLGTEGIGTVIGYFTKSFIPIVKQLISWFQTKD